VTTRRLGVRTRLLLAIVAAVAGALAVGVAAFNVVLGQQLSAGASDLARAEAIAELSSVRVVNGRVAAPEGANEGTVASQVWVFAGSRILEAPRVPSQIDAAARALAGGPERSIRVGENVRMHAVPIVQGGRRYGTVVAAVSLDAYRQTERTALVGSLVPPQVAEAIRKNPAKKR